MNKVRGLFKRRQSYEPLDGDSSHSAGLRSNRDHEGQADFSWLAYFVFLLLGIAMLWAWNGLMAASPYFHLRFETSKSILRNFQASELAVSTVANLGSVLVLTNLQANASYPRRIVISLMINMVMFILLAITTRTFLGVTPAVYFAFLLAMVFATSLATGFMQNGSFAYIASYKRPEYMQALMLGQAVAGVLPPIVQIASVLGAKEVSSAAESGTSTSAFAYFLTATGISAFSLLAFIYLLTRKNTRQTSTDANSSLLHHEEDEDDPTSPNIPKLAPKRSVPLTYLAKRLFYPAAAVFLTFSITMVFPVFTQGTLSTNPDPPPFLREAAFVPLGLLFWNAGDLVGRLLPLVPRLSLATRPKILLFLSIARLIFIPLYLMCNFRPTRSDDNIERNALPDAVYLLIVQLPFGISNGYLGSCCMMGSSLFVEEREVEAAGAFMGLTLVSGLAVGSFCSFFVGNG